MSKRAFVIVLDSFGIGNAPDAAAFGDGGSNTLAAIASAPGFSAPHLGELGLFNIDGVTCAAPVKTPEGAYGRMLEKSRGKDTTVGHWELMGVESETPLPTFPQGFPSGLVEALQRETGHTFLCNRPYSGTEVLRDYGEEHLRTGGLILYTSADSVLQLAAHVDKIPLEELYRCCEKARALAAGPWAVGRVIARPFAGEAGAFYRTKDRHDYSLPPPGPTLLDYLKDAGKDVVAVGKIQDIFAGRGITRHIKTAGNTEGMQAALRLADEDFDGLAFINLVDFDMIYGHRNDVAGYAGAVMEFDAWLPGFLKKLRDEDMLVITADHGCDPSTPSTDHSREAVPLLCAGPYVKKGVRLGTLDTFACLAATLAEYFMIKTPTSAQGVLTALRARV
ncbi:MAG: phosphopentomutase [Oscillospiraceae bacterium]|nr:phosphopentomutase [Oscillospiraceae bacterium]